MGSNVRHLTCVGRGGGKAAVIAGTAAALLSTGTATAANITPTHVPAATVSHHNPDSRPNSSKPRTGSGRDPVWLGPGRSMVAGRLVPGRPSLDRVIVR
jgi:hypothetical protein